MRLTPSELKRVERTSTFYDVNRRDLPWRKTNDPYKSWFRKLCCNRPKLRRLFHGGMHF